MRDNPAYDELLVETLLGAARARRIGTMGEFSQFARTYLDAGYSREVSEACRRYFALEPMSDQSMKVTVPDLRKWRQAMTTPKAA